MPCKLVVIKGDGDCFQIGFEGTDDIHGDEIVPEDAPLNAKDASTDLEASLDREYDLACRAAAKAPGAKIVNAYQEFGWETKTAAKTALASINLTLKHPAFEDLLEWQRTALAAGWKPPRGFKMPADAGKKSGEHK